MELNIDEINEVDINNNIYTNLNYFEDAYITDKNNNINTNNILPKPKLKRQTNNIISENNLKRVNQPIPKTYSKQVRLQQAPAKQQISYDDILNKMGMFVKDGQLHLVEDQVKYNNKSNMKNVTKNVTKNVLNNTKNTLNNTNITGLQNSYIYNKFFKDELKQDNAIAPKTMAEYKALLINNIIQKERAKRIKSRQLIMPNSNINISGRHNGDLNKLFNFSGR
jgi:hypothetical protein